MAGDSFAEVTGVFTSIEHFDVNSGGDAAFVGQFKLANESSFHLFSWSGLNLQRIAGAGSEFAGFPGLGPNYFSHLSLDDRGRLFFAAQRSRVRAGFFLWERGEVLKIVVDGEPSPLGGRYQLGFIPCGPGPNCWPYPANFEFTLTRLNEAREVAFHAQLPGAEQGSALFVWRAGIVEPIEVRGLAPPDLGDRVFTGAAPLVFNANGKLLLKAFLCCGGLGTALLTAESARPHVQYLPLIGVGTTSDLEYTTLVNVANHSQLPAFVNLEVFNASGQMLRDFPRQFILDAGGIQRIELRDRELTTGYLRMTTLRGDVTLSGIIRLSKNHRLESQTGITAGLPAPHATMVAELNQRTNIAIAVANPGSDSARVEIRMETPAGVVDRRLLDLAPGTQNSLFASELLAVQRPGFAGIIRLSSDRPVLVAGLRLADLQLSTLPVDSASSQATREWGFTNVFPMLQWPVADFFKEAFANRRGHTAVRTSIPKADGFEETEIKLISEGSVITIARPGMVFSDGQTRIPDKGSGLRLIGLNDDDDVLFMTLFERPASASFGLFLWRKGKIEPVAVNEQQLPDGTQVRLASFDPTEPHRAIAVLTSAGTVALRGDGLYFYDGTLRRVFGSVDKVSGESNLSFLWAVSLDAAEDGRIAFATPAVLGLYDGKTMSVLATRNHPISGTSRKFREFGAVRIGRSNTIVFSGTVFDPFQAGLFALVENQIRPLLLDGDPVPGRPHTSFRFELDSLGVSSNPLFNLAPSAFQINHHNRVALLITVEEPAENPANNVRTKSLLLADTAGNIDLLMKGGSTLPILPLDRIYLRALRWNNSNQLLIHTAFGGPHRGEGLLIWEEGKIRRVILPGQRASLPSAPPNALSNVWTLWDFTDSGRALITGFAFPGPSGLFIGVPGNFQQSYLPHLAHGDFGSFQFKSTLVLHNRGSVSSSVRLHLFSSDNFRAESTEEMTIGPSEVKFFTPQLVRDFLGWARVDVTGGELQLFGRIAIFKEGQMISEVTLPATPLSSAGLWQGSASAHPPHDTGLAISNPHPVPIELKLEQLGAGRQVQRTVAITIPALGHKAALLSELFAPLSSHPQLFRFQSPLPLAAVVLMLDSLRITSLPLSKVN